jgi:hypothetical protein
MRGWRALIATVALVAVGLVAGSVSTALAVTSATAAASSLLPRGFVVPLGVVRQYFPRVTRQQQTGANTTSSGIPVASRQVIYANAGASIKVTLSVDQYASSKRASSAFDEAARNSKKVHGFSPLRTAKVGQRSAAGTVTQGNETHVGIVALQGGMIVQATIAGFAAMRANISKIVALTRRELATAERQCARKPGCTRR